MTTDFKGYKFFVKCVVINIILPSFFWLGMAEISRSQGLQLPAGNALEEMRKEINLNGNWRFMPSFEEDKLGVPYSRELDDSDWYSLPVPSFWNEIGWWLFDGKSGGSDNFRSRERERCRGYDFDYTRVNTGWYRKWFHIPKEYEGKHIRVRFMAVATIAEVWLNGEHVGGHVGMFTPFECDLTEAIRYGEMNLLTVMVSVGKYDGNPGKVIKTVVTVDVTDHMLNSSPRAMYKPVFDGAREVTHWQGGIWQSVSLIISDKTRIEDVFVIPGLTSAEVQVEIAHHGERRGKIKIINRFIDKSSGQILFEDGVGRIVTLDTQKKIKEIFHFDGIRPKLWSPEYPNLYILQTDIAGDNEIIDRKNTTIGFRTVEVKEDKLYLNGQPYWIRGANMPPHGLAPNDKILAHKFLKLMHDGNQMCTRTTGSPFPEVWAAAADEEGVAVSLEGIWPWVMIGNSPLPAQEKVDRWKKQHLELVKALRNHPSIILWTINNEMYFHDYQGEHGDKNQQRRLTKWEIVSSLIKEIRKIDGTRPIIADSGYRRNIEDYDTNLLPRGIDDGDIDDAHLYFGWYSPIPYWLNEGHFRWLGMSGARPALVQECSTGYPDLDTGHAVDRYITRHLVPQAWVGDDAYKARDSSVFLENHRFITKEVAELMRRQHEHINGILLFSNLCWFRNSYDAQNIEPYPVYNSVKLALSPVLVSMKYIDRHFWAGSKFYPHIFIINDDSKGRNLTNLLLEYSIVGKDGKILARGSRKVEDVPYYTTSQMEMQIEIPDNLPKPRADYLLKFNLKSNGRVISQNEYKILIATSSFSEVSSKAKRMSLTVYDREGSLKAALKSFGIDYDVCTPLYSTRLRSYHALIIGKNSVDDTILKSSDELRKYVHSGGKILSLEGGVRIKEWLPGVVDEAREERIEFVNMNMPTSPLFQDMSSQDLKWWHSKGGKAPTVCDIAFKLKENENVTKLGEFIKVHAYLNNPSDIASLTAHPLFELREGDGLYIISELSTSKYDVEPLAAKFLSNAISYLALDLEDEELLEEEEPVTFYDNLEITDVVNCPNPFRKQTAFTYFLNQTADEVDIVIYTASGRRIRRISDASSCQGYNEEKWDGKDENGRQVANGTYLYKITAKRDDEKVTKVSKLVILR